jgi:hypothetical protein
MNWAVAALPAAGCRSWCRSYCCSRGRGLCQRLHHLRHAVISHPIAATKAVAVAASAVHRDQNI